LRAFLELLVVFWSRRVDEPIVLDDGTELPTLRHAIEYLAKTVPKGERNHPKVATAGDAAGDPSERRARVHRSQRPPLGQAHAEARCLVNEKPAGLNRRAG
jgi:hypothetical protein